MWVVITFLSPQVKGDRELNVVTFDSRGRVKSYCTGVVVAEGVYSKVDPSTAAEIKEMQQKLINQEDKLKTLVGQEGKTAYQKVGTTKRPLLAFAMPVMTVLPCCRWRV